MTTRRTMRAALAAGGLLATLCPALLRAQERAIVLRGGTVVPVDGAPIPNGTVVMRGGKIVAVQGIGGFQFMLDARNERAVTRFCARQPREE